jgi:hypothetical protein
MIVQELDVTIRLHPTHVDLRVTGNEGSDHRNDMQPPEDNRSRQNTSFPI